MNLEERKAKAFDCLGEALLLLDLEGSIEGCNLAAEKLLQKPSQELVGQPFSRLSVVSDPFFDVSGLRRLEGLGTIGDTEKELKSGSGTIVAALSMSCLKDEEGLLWGYLCLAVNVQARREMQDELLKTFEQKNLYRSQHALRDNFFSNISHELRTPLNSIIGYSEILEEELEEMDLEENILCDVSSIKKAGSHLLDLINRVLEISRMDSESVGAELASLDVQELLTELAEEIGPIAGQQQVCFRLEPFSNLGEIASDRKKLKECLRQLLDNALKFTDGGGSVHLDGQRLEDQLVISIKDTGIGMAEEELAHAFCDFAQGDDGKSRKYGGAGLGLSVVRRYAKLIGATLEVSSQKGLGTTVCLLVPLNFNPGRQVEAL